MLRLEHSFHPADHIDAENVVGYEENRRPEDTGYCHAGHDLAFVSSKAECEYHTYGDRQKHRCEQRYTKEAGMFTDLDQKTALAGKFAAKTLREGLYGPCAEIGAQIGEEYDTGQAPQYIGYSAGDAHICRDHSESQQGEFHRRTQEDEDV